MSIVEARAPDGRVVELVEVDLTKSGLLLVLTDTDGNQVLIHRFAWEGVIKAVHDLVEARRIQAKKEAEEVSA